MNNETKLLNTADLKKIMFLAKYFIALITFSNKEIPGTWQISGLLLQILTLQPPGCTEAEAEDWKKVQFSVAVEPQPTTTEMKKRPRHFFLATSASLVKCFNAISHNVLGQSYNL